MISLKRWVHHNLDMLQKLVLLIMDWVNRTPEIGCDYDIATFKSKLYRWIYKSYVLQQREDFNPYDPELYEYFSMKFSEDIIDIFLQCRDLTKSYNSTLFHKAGDVSLDIEQCLFTYLLIEDPYNDDYDSDEENNIDNNIYESEI